MKRISLSVGVVLLAQLVMLGTIHASPNIDLDATTLYVATYGSDIQSCGAAAAPCRTIQTAIDRIGEGGTGEIRVAEGSYHEDRSCVTGSAVVCVLNKQVILQGGYSNNWESRNPSGHPVILDGEGRVRVVRVQQTTPASPHAFLTLEGVTVQNGYYRADSTGDRSRTYGFGGGLLAEHASLTVKDAIFRNNRVLGGSTEQEYGGGGAGGGIAVKIDPAYVADAKVSLDSVTFDGNEARGGDGSQRGGCAHGGALFLFGVSVRGSQLTFTNNKALGGFGRGDGYSDADNEKADALGGAASIQTGSTVNFDHVAATGNLARGGDAPNGDAGNAYGGAFAVEKATFTLSDSDVRGNTALGADGRNSSMSASIASGGGLSTIGYAPTNVYLYRVWFIANTAKSGNGQVYGGASGGGGAALTYSDGQYVVSNCVFAQNSVDIGSGKWVGGGGGGLWLQGVRASVDYVTFAGNRLSEAVQSHGAQGLGLILVTAVPGAWPNTVADIHSALITDHRSISTPGGGLAALQAAPNTTANISGGVWANNTKNDNSGDSAPWRGSLNGLSSMHQASSAGYIAPAAPNYNYHLKMNSPAKDCGPEVRGIVDIDGQPRAYASAGDAGADEYWPFTVSTASRPQALIADWTQSASVLAGAVDRYRLTVHCPAGASAPKQAGCDKPTDIGKTTTMTLTGLTDGKQYDLTVAALDASGGAIAQSAQFTATPGAHLINLPSVVK